LSFTGTLASMTHKQAMELAEQHGGSATHSVSKQTTMLTNGWPSSYNGQPLADDRMVVCLLTL